MRLNEVSLITIKGPTVAPSIIKSLILLVGAWGFEPQTPTVSR